MWCARPAVSLYVLPHAPCFSAGTYPSQVGDRIVDTRSEWRTFANDDQNNDDPSRVGESGNPLFEDAVATLQTTIGREGSNAFHLMKTQAKGMEKGAVAIKEGFAKIRNLTDTLQVGKAVQEYAQHILRRTYIWFGNILELLDTDFACSRGREEISQGQASGCRYRRCDLHCVSTE